MIPRLTFQEKLKNAIKAAKEHGYDVKSISGLDATGEHSGVALYDKKGDRVIRVPAATKISLGKEIDKKGLLKISKKIVVIGEPENYKTKGGQFLIHLSKETGEKAEIEVRSTLLKRRPRFSKFGIKADSIIHQKKIRKTFSKLNEKTWERKALTPSRRPK